MPDHDKDMLRYETPRSLKLFGIVAAAVAVLIVVVGLVARFFSTQAVASWTAAHNTPTVSVISLASAGANRALVLPGQVEAFYNAPIYARVSGYLKKWYVDIGTPVKAGQLMAEIDVPDQDQQLAQAKADLNTAIANEHLSALTAKRWNALAKLNAVSQQDVDEKNGDLAAKTAAVASAKANVDRLNDLESFKSITAPFDGTVTSRNTDIGALIVVGSPTISPLFTVADESRVRIYVNVPQNYAAEIHPGLAARFTVPEYPGRVFAATLVGSANSVSAATGTDLVQLQAANPDHALRQGDYAQVQLDLPNQGNIVEVPSSALLFRDNGMTIVTVGAGNRVAIRHVDVVRDLGTTVEIAAQFPRSDRIVNNPPDSIRNGDIVQIAPSGKPANNS
jgi:RND family efflux transporter MFP subunit